jgi:hypothetical protein
MTSAIPGAVGLHILYVGQALDGTNGADRIRILQDFGCNVSAFDPYSASGGYSKLERRFAHRYNLGRPVRALNKKLAEWAQGQSFDLAWINKAMWLTPATLRRISERAHAMLHFTLDSHFGVNQSHHLYKSIPLFDLVVTTKDREEPNYVALDARRFLAIQPGYGPRIELAAAADDPADTRFSSDVTFIGRCEPHYAQLLEEVAELGVDLRIWGAGWEAYASRHSWARKPVQGEGLWGIEYGLALRQAKIALGLLRKSVNDDVTTRSVEIPGAGGFLLAERTPQHSALFAEGEEAVFFSDSGELKRAILTYIDNSEARTRIAAAGHARARLSGYSERDQIGQVLRAALAVMHTSGARSETGATTQLVEIKEAT